MIKKTRNIILLVVAFLLIFGTIKVKASEFISILNNRGIYSSVRLRTLTFAGNSLGEELVWSTSNKTSVGVNETGKIIARKRGSAEISVYSKANPNEKKKVEVTVKNKTIQKITYSESMEMLRGNGRMASIPIAPKSSNMSQVRWSSSDSDIVSVDSSGYIKGMNKGKAVITGTTNDGTGMTTILTVTVESCIIMLDPGHGSNAPGAISPVDQTKEKLINLQIAMTCKKELETYAGVTVYLTRSDDTTNPTLKERALMAKDKNANLMVSLHNNASDSHEDIGAVIYVSQSKYKDRYNKESTLLANCILNQIGMLGIQNVGVKTKSAVNDTYVFNGITELADYYGIIRECIYLDVPSILVEHAYMDSCDYTNFLNTNEKRNLLGLSDATGIALYYGFEKIP